LAEKNAKESLFEEELTHQIKGAAIDVHRFLGPGLLESAYQRCLAHELTIQGLFFEQEFPIPVIYKDINLDCGYRADQFQCSDS
jgi:GxxExxY protein